MAREPQPIDITQYPELTHLIEEMQASQMPRPVKRGSEILAILMPAPSAPKKRSRRGRPLSRADALWQLVGSAQEAPPTDASKKYEYLAEAYSPQQS